MARRKSGRRKGGRRGGSGRRSSGGVDGMMAGAGVQLLASQNPLINAAVVYGVGRWRGNETLETLAGFAAGKALASGAGGLLSGLTGAIGGGASGGNMTAPPGSVVGFP